MKFDITTIGNASMDTFLELNDVCYQQDFEKNKHFFCFQVGCKVPITNLQENFGGNAANTAVGFSRLGLRTAIVSSLDLGLRCQHLSAYLQKEKISTRYIKSSHKTPINLSYILDWHKDKNDRIILSHHRPKNFSHIKWPQTTWVYLTSLGKDYKKVVRQLPNNVKIAFTPGGFEIKQGVRYILNLLKKTEVLLLNQEEAALLTNIDTAEFSSRKKKINKINHEFLFKNLLKLGPEVVVITCGQHGAYAKSQTSDKTYFVPGIEVSKIKEVTGAGDAFASGFVSAYIKDKKLKQCLRWGVLNSTSCIQEIGAQNGLLKIAGLRREYRKRYK